MMKIGEHLKLAFLILVVSFFSSISLFAEKKYNMNEVNRLIGLIVDKGLNSVDSAIEVKVLRESEEFKSLQNEISDNWGYLMENFELINHKKFGKWSVSGQFIAVMALGELSNSDYMEALDGIGDLYINGKVEKRILNQAMSPYMFPKKHFAVDNYDHPRMISLLEKVRDKFPDDVDMVARFNRILSGVSKNELEKFRMGHKGLAEGLTPPNQIETRLKNEKPADREKRNSNLAIENSKKIHSETSDSDDEIESKPSRLLWAIVGVFLLGILVFLFKAFKGKSTS